ncbi:MAG: hypothetical protein PHG58_06230 [Clostridia bacterium]|nr:hypothetical protein [Clostridia bacterium]
MAQKISITKIVVALSLIITLLLIPFQVFAQEENTENKNYNFAPGHVIVALKQGHENAFDNLDNFPDIVIDSIKKLTKSIFLLKFNSSDKEDVFTTIEKLKTNPNVKYAEPNYYVYFDYTLTVIPDPAYHQSYNTPDGGINTMIVNSNISGLIYFGVQISPGWSHHWGMETVVFVHQRNGFQLSLNATRADFDQVSTAHAGFNVQPGDMVKVFIVDDLTKNLDFNPTVLSS